jgi:hypothetical protein
MHKLILSTCTIAVAVAALFVWAHFMVTPSQATTVLSINPTEMMANYAGPLLPVEQWDAF